ncbi:MAG: M4 family metallopeptidase [Ferruginibacter sp.]|nr:M4 family metallopeptidase [Ferruginibacter sp.]
MKTFLRLLLAIYLVPGTGVLMAQPGFQNMTARADKERGGDAAPAFTLTINPKNPFLATMLINKDVNIPQSGAQQWITDQLNLRSGIDQLTTVKDFDETSDLNVLKLAQYFKKIHLEHGIINLGAINGRLALVNMEFYPIDPNFSITPTISEADALNKAMNYINAQKYAWQGYTGNDSILQKPRGELVIIKDYLSAKDTVCLAYKFVILAESPFSSSTIYVNAMSGAVPLKNSNLSDLHASAPTPPAEKILCDVETGKSVLLETPSPLTSTNNETPAPTRYSGTQKIYTNQLSSPTRYELLQTWNGNDIEIKNYGNRDPTFTNNALATAISSPNNQWVGNDTTAVEVSFNMKIVSDYWKTTHNIVGWDLANSPIVCFVHAGVKYDNAFWDKNNHNIYFGDGLTNSVTSLDVCGHEFGHAINEKIITGTGFINSREPGALDEGFADIWGACIENFVNTQFNSLHKDIWKNGEEIYPIDANYQLTGTSKLKDFINPKIINWPDTYYGTNWIKSNKDDCPTPDDTPGTGNDNCGTHYNAAVLTKWFSLIGIGGSGTNDHNYNYTVAPIGIGVADAIAFNTLMLLTPSSDFTTAMNVSINYVNSNYAADPNVLTQVVAAWRAVGLLDTMLYTYPQISDFPTSNSFTCVAVGKGGQVWAGTSRVGLYKYNGSKWEKASGPNAVTINRLSYRDIKADKKGGIWIAQAGGNTVTGVSNDNGGVDYFDDSTFTSRRHYISAFLGSSTTTVPLTRNATGIFVDTMSINWDAFIIYGKNLPKIWTASLGMTTTTSGMFGAAINTSGGLGLGLYDSTSIGNVDSNFIKIAESYSATADKYATSRGAQTVAGNDTEVWSFSDANFETSLSSWGINYNGAPSQITVYRSANSKYYGYSPVPDEHANGDSLTVLNNSRLPAMFDASFIAKAIYFDKFDNRWVGLQQKGVRVQDKNHTTPTTNWHNLNALPGFTDIFPANTIVSNNAISGDKNGVVYIGTNNGLVVYTGTSPADLENPKFYARYTTRDGLPNNAVRGVGVDHVRKGVWLATDNGLILWRQRGAERSIGITEIKTSCVGNTIKYALEVKGKYAAANNIIIELSDANGNFAAPTIVATKTLNSDYNDYEFYTYPLSLPNGTGYKMRGRSTNPVIIGGPSRPIKIQRDIKTLPSQGAVTLIANRECLDALGWTNYYYDNHTITEDDDQILLSIFKAGNTIGTIGDGSFVVKVASTTLAGQNTARLITTVNSVAILHPFISINRYWQVIPTTQPSAANPVYVRFYYNTQDLNDVNGNSFYTAIPHDKLVFFKTSTGNPDPDTYFAGATDFTSYTNGAAPGLTTWKYTQIDANVHRAEFMVDHFSGGGAGSTQDGTAVVILPVELLSFDARLNGNKTLLNWSTAIEINTDYFEVQRSADGIQFTGFAKVPAAGNSSTQKKYSATDGHPSGGNNYYRLKIVDKDGKIKYSSTRLIVFDKNYARVNIYPSPAKSIINIEGNFKSRVVNVHIFDATGKLLLKQNKTNAAIIEVNINGLAAGTYIVKTDDGHETTNSRFIKE